MSSYVTHTYRVSNLFKDYCGVLNEESIRLNFVLIYELLDEVLVRLLLLYLITPSYITHQDYGYPQVTSTEVLKSYVHNSPVETVTGPTESTVSKVMFVCVHIYP